MCKLKKSKKIVIIILAILALFISISVGIGILIIKSNENKGDIDNGFRTEILYFEDLYESKMEYSKDKDTDADGLSDYDEYYVYNTSPFSCDTDLDGLSDYDEINNYNTDPIKADTDGDTLSDGCEVAKGLNPLKVKTDGNTYDALIKFEENYNYEAVKLCVTGDASVANIYVDKFEASGLSTTYGLASDVYEFYKEGKFETATLTIKYDNSVIEKYNYNEDELSIYQFDNEGNWIKVNSTVDKTNNEVKAELNHFSRYAVLDSSKISTTATTDIQVFYVIDDSGSMYDPSVANSTGWIANDPEFKRFDFVEKLTERLGSKVKVGMGVYTGTYYHMLELGAGIEEIKSITDELRKDREHNFNGTCTIDAAYAALDNFNDSIASRNFMVILTDGDDNCSYYDIGDLVKKANEMNVTIIIIGLGQMLDVDRMIDISSGTNGDYVYVSNSDAIEQVYNKIMNLLYYNFIDEDKDGENDSILVADSNFDVNKDGLSFSNPITKFDGNMGGGLCYGIAALCQLNHLGIVPANISELSITDYDLWFLRLIASPFIDEIYIENVSSIKNEELTELGFVENNGYMRMDNINEMLTSETTKLVMSIEKISADEKYVVNSDSEAVYKSYIQKKINEEPVLQLKFNKAAEGATFLGEEYTKFHVLYYDFDKLNKKNTDEEAERTKTIMKLLLRLWAEQFNDDGLNDVRQYSINDDWNEIIGSLKSGIALCITVNENHEVNLIRITRDIDNPTAYNMYIYDNNCPNQEIKYEIVEYSLHGSDEVKYNVYNTSDELVSTEFLDFTHHYN